MSQNQESIAFFLNRPVIKVRMENQWQRIGDREVRTLLSSYIGSGFFDFDVEGVKRKLESHPWVANAEVKRIWPDTLSLQLTEQIAIARWGENKLLNQYGEIFQPSTLNGLAGLPGLTGPDKSQYDVMQQYQQLSQILFPSGLKLSELTLSRRGSWEMTLSDGLRVVMGRTDVMEKTQRFVAFYGRQAALTSSRFVSVDLRYSNGFAVQSVESNLTGVAIR